MPQPVTVSISLGTHDPKTVDNRNDFSLESSENNIASGRKKTPPSVNTTGIAPVSGVSQDKGNKNATTKAAAPPQPPPPPARPTIKRTKKVAKPKKRAKKGPPTRAKRLPTKSARANDVPTKKSTPISKNKGGKSASSVSQSKPPTPKKIQTETNNSKAKSKKPKSNAGDPIKKRARKRKSQDTSGGDLSTAKNQKSKGKSQTSLNGAKPEPEPAKPGLTEPEPELEIVLPTSVKEDSKIEKVVSIVVDTIADEIRYCASMFGTKHPQVVIRCNAEDSSDKELSRDPPVDDIEEFSSSKKSKAKSSSLKTDARNSAGSYSVHITEGGTLHPVKNSHVAKPVKYGTSPNKKGSTSHNVPSQGTSSVSEMYDVRMVVLALKRFAFEVYVPFLRSAKTTMENSSPNHDRIQISTFLAIREMLIMNADKLFVFPTLKGPSTNMAKRERFYASRVLANAIVRNAAKRMYLHQPESHFFADFVQATHNYDAKSDDFQFSLARAGAQSQYAYSDGKQVGYQEALLAKVSFNYARARHPLLHSKKVSLGEAKEEGSIGNDRSPTQHLPAPSACAAFHIEFDATSSSDESEDDEELMKSLRNVLKSKRST